MVVGFYEVVDGEVILPLVQSCAPSNDLLKLDHGVHRTHQDDVPHIPSIHTSTQLLAGGQDRGDCLFVVHGFPADAAMGASSFSILLRTDDIAERKARAD
jgi:hypothetical protein